MDRTSIALVDSSRAFISIARFLLTAFYRERCELVGVAGSAEEGLQLAREQHPEVVLLDLGLEGHQLISDLRAAGAGAVIYMGADNAEGYRQAALDAGADAFMLKSELNTALLPIISRLRGGD
jgi:DNA-binding NarL/FixJ family response regulator